MIIQSTQVEKEELKNSIDVIIPHKNQVDFLWRSLQSIWQQTLPINKVIVVDDCSNDIAEVSKVIRAYVDLKLPVELVANDGTGVSSARNTGIRKSSAAFVAFLDADDYWYPEKMENQLKQFIKDQELIANFVGFRVINSLGAILREENAVGDNVSAFELLTHSKGIAGSASSIMIKRNAMVQCGFFDESLTIGEDLDYWIRLADFGKIQGVPEILVLITDNPSSTQRSLPEITRLQLELSALSKIIAKHPKSIESSVAILLPILIRLSRLQPIKAPMYMAYPFKVITNGSLSKVRKIKGLARLVLIWLVKAYGIVLYHYARYRIQRNIGFRIMRKIYLKLKYEIEKRVITK